MAVSNFAELLHKLKETHEQEVEGWQEKVMELTNKKNCDGKRLEELYNKNQQMKEQQRILTDNIKQLENMLRAGLCDRCTVTQEVAKKRQQDYESSQLQSLQHISILMTEVSALMKENEKLKEEVKGLRRRIEQQNGHPEETKSPEVKHSPDPSARMTSVLKSEQSPVGGATTSVAVVKREIEHGEIPEPLWDRKEASDKGSEHKLIKEWSGTSPFESSKFPTLVNSVNLTTWRDRRAVSVDTLEPRTSPTAPSLPFHLHLLKKNPFTPEERRQRLSIPVRPYPIKTAPPSLRWPLLEHADWMTMATMGSGAHTNVNQDSTSTMPRYSGMVSPPGGLEPRLRVQGTRHQRPWSDQLVCSPQRSHSNSCDSREGRTTVSVISSPSWKGPAQQPERIFGENLREREEETPLDLSSAGGSKVNEAQTIETEKQRDIASCSSSSSSPPAPLSSPSSAQYASSPQSDPQTADTKPQQEETWERPKEEEEEEDEEEEKKEKKEEKEKKENGECSGNVKIPTLSISLRPVVVLESLKTAAKKEQDTEQSNSPQEQEEEEEYNQSTARKRPGQDNEVLSRRLLMEKRMRLMVMPQGFSHGDSEQG